MSSIIIQGLNITIDEKFKIIWKSQWEESFKQMKLLCVVIDNAWILSLLWLLSVISSERKIK